MQQIVLAFTGANVIQEKDSQNDCYKGNRNQENNRRFSRS